MKVAACLLDVAVVGLHSYRTVGHDYPTCPISSKGIVFFLGVFVLVWDVFFCCCSGPVVLRSRGPLVPRSWYCGLLVRCPLVPWSSGLCCVPHLCAKWQLIACIKPPSGSRVDLLNPIECALATYLVAIWLKFFLKSLSFPLLRGYCRCRHGCSAKQLLV